VRRAKSPSEAGDAAARDVIFHNPWATIDLRAAQLPLPGGRHKTVDGWLWVAVRNHINALVQVQPEEALTIWGAAGLRAAALSRDVLVHPAPSGGVPRASLGAARVLVAAAAAAGRNEVGAHNEPLYVLYRQEKYAYLGPSLAVVGGLNEPETDATLHATVHRELREELGLVCRAVQSLGRFVNDANRGCGVFETFAASQCVASPRTEHDLAEADVEAQAPVLLTAADLRDILRRTRDAAELGVRVPKAMGTFPAVVVPDGVSAETGAGLERPALNAYAAAGRDESAVWVTDISGLYIKESKWAATVALGLEYFTH
jgi:ADP-ribose pyrophosphatase YjhB (NUDIX family)